MEIQTAPKNIRKWFGLKVVYPSSDERAEEYEKLVKSNKLTKQLKDLRSKVNHYEGKKYFAQERLDDLENRRTKAQEAIDKANSKLHDINEEIDKIEQQLLDWGYDI